MRLMKVDEAAIAFAEARRVNPALSSENLKALAQISAYVAKRHRRNAAQILNEAAA